MDDVAEWAFYGGFEGDPLGSSSQELVAVARKWFVRGRSNPAMPTAVVVAGGYSTRFEGGIRRSRTSSGRR